MKAYISISYSKRKFLQESLTVITSVLQEHSIEPIIFTDLYKFEAAEERIMMQQAFTVIDDCDFLVAETSDKAIGIGVEAGYAKAKNKPVIYIRQQEADHSTTVSGTSDFQIIYTDAKDLKNQFSVVVKRIIAALNKDFHA